jgi:4-hydroxy-3-methylbut-2-enyl diphosphate reductase
MHVILANPRGFCAGVNMAVEALETALTAFGTPIYAYHEIVHNRPVVEKFKARGVVFVDSIDEVPEGGTVLYSAHGVSPVIREASIRRKLRAIDATCPLVTKVHTEAIRYAKDGFTIVLIGHEGHDEVVGTMGEVPHAIVLVENEADVAKLTLPADVKVAYLTQTTLSVVETTGIIAAEEGPAECRPRQVGHLLRDAESPGSCKGSVGPGPRCARARQPEQFQ